MKYYVLVSLLILVLLVVFTPRKKSEPYIESYDSTKLLSSDISGNISLVDNIIPSLRSKSDSNANQILQLNDQITQLNNQITQLRNQINSIINGSTRLNNLSVNENLTIHTSSQVPLTIKKTNDDKTGVLEWVDKNGNRYKLFGVDGNTNPWSGSGWG